MHDVLIIGAGAAGLMAAKILSEAKLNVCILEARNRTGGRIHTIDGNGFSIPAEAGAEFVHGKLKLTATLLKESGIDYYRTTGKLWQVKNGELKKREDFIENADELAKKLNELKEDISISAFLEFYFSGEKYARMKWSLRQFIEGYDAADIDDASALALRDEWNNEDDDQYRPEQGYGKMIFFLQSQCISNGCQIELSREVKHIKWNEDHAEVFSDDVFLARKVIITVPVSLVANNTISFEPALPGIISAAKQIGYGGVIKIIMQFSHPFWESEGSKAEDMFFVFSEQKIPTWWSRLPDTAPALCGWLAGPRSMQLTDKDDETILKEGLNSLSAIFKIPPGNLQQYLVAFHVHNWNADKFSMGGYSYNSITTAAAKRFFREPVANTIFFAGEAYADINATVESALLSGKETAGKILALSQ